MTGTRILLSPPDTGELEQRYVSRAMMSGWVAPAGPDLAAFEGELAERCGVKYAVALSSGTAALHLALLSWKVGPGDVVVTSTMTFAATVNAILYCGAEPHFVDCEPTTGNMDPHLLEDALSYLRAAGRRAAVVIPVDMLGKLADYPRIEELARLHGARILSDAAEAMGSSHRGDPAGSKGDAAAISFNGNKIMTTSGGGVLLSSDEALVERARYLSTQARQPSVHYQHTEVGYNYRMSNILAALGRAQLSRLTEMVNARRQVRASYRKFCESVGGLSILDGGDDAEDNCWLTALLLSEQTHTTPVQLHRHLAERGIETRPIWKPMHLQPVYRRFAATLNGSAESLFATALLLPSGSSLTQEELEEVQGAIMQHLESSMVVPGPHSRDAHRW